jgi:diguanylate cyclase (GGDEF)-like protein/PAS domain S-box-containing protein
MSRALPAAALAVPPDLPSPDPDRDNVELALALRELARTRRALDRLERRHRVLIEGLEDGVLVLDEAGRLEAMNDGATRLLGGSDAFVRRWIWADPEPGGAGEAVHPAVEALLDARPRLAVPMRIAMTDGSERWLSVSARPVLDPTTQRVQSVVCSFTDVTQRRTREADLERQATVDALTGVYNRRYLEDRLIAEVSRARRTRQPLALAIADLDRFKSINDAHGHGGGDAALRCFARVMREAVRTEDIVARLGGDEFCMVFPGTSALAARAALERVIAQLAETPVVHGAASFRVSGTFGVADLKAGVDSLTLMARADAALYAAKAAGRGCVRIAE